MACVIPPPFDMQMIHSASITIPPFDRPALFNIKLAKADHSFGCPNSQSHVRAHIHFMLGKKAFV